MMSSLSGSTLVPIKSLKFPYGLAWTNFFFFFLNFADVNEVIFFLALYIMSL